MSGQATTPSAAGQGPVIYRAVPCYPNYRVGTDGSIWRRSEDRRPRRRRAREWIRLKGTLIPRPTKTGNFYVRVTLCGPTARRTLFLHRLILETFVGPCPPGMETRHANDVGTDNRLENLGWGSPVENKADAARNGKTSRGSRRYNAKLNECQVAAIKGRLAGGEAATAIAKDYGVGPDVVLDIKWGKTWKHVLPSEQ